MKFQSQGSVLDPLVAFQWKPQFRFGSVPTHPLPLFGFRVLRHIRSVVCEQGDRWKQPMVSKKLHFVNVCDPYLTVEVSIWIHHRKNIPAIVFLQYSRIILQDLQWIPVQFLGQVRVCLVVLYKLTAFKEKII